MQKNKVCYKLYLVADYNNEDVDCFCEQVARAILGGVSFVQLRAKNSSTKDMLLVGRALKKLTDKYNIPLVVNDRLDVALLINCNGVHLGQQDAPIKEARELLGREKIIGATTKTIKQAILAQNAGADYVGAGALFTSSTKTNAIAMSMDLLKDIKKSISLPVVAIGGINTKNIDKVPTSYIDGVAVSSGILKEQNIQKAAADLSKSLAK
ncbi:thiamine phosphate synthase [Proteinivorax hydrogeniformans]|uniref:Thiamine-phosphate synthase n=1 Tax=Proteinivorax hydrogeniformans TaxID=1826727 RepID=A0AAU8HVS9_9FIRM